MGFLKSLGKLAGEVVGEVVSIPATVAGELVDSDFLREVGKGTKQVTARTGVLLGNVAEGATDIVSGVVTSDSQKLSDGAGKVFDSAETYATGVVRGVGRRVGNGLETVDAILDGDTERAVKVGKEIVKTVAIGTLAVGIGDVVGGVMDGLDHDFDHDHAYDYDHHHLLAENPNMHHVTPHYRTLSDGRRIWVDGDGDTSVDTYGGWEQSNPDYEV